MLPGLEDVDAEERLNKLRLFTEAEERLQTEAEGRPDRGLQNYEMQ